VLVSLAVFLEEIMFLFSFSAELSNLKEQNAILHTPCDYRLATIIPLK
jgi:hypothetical protein